MEIPEHPSEKSAPHIGDLAPNFALPDEQDVQHELANQLRAGRPIVLVFMRGEW